MERIKQLQQSLKLNRLNAVLISKPENVRYLCGYSGTNGRLLVTLKNTTLITDFRYLRSAKAEIPKGVKIYDQKDGLNNLIGRFKKIGVEDEHLTYSRYLILKKNFPKLKLKPISGIVEDMRMIKDDSEIRIIRKAVSIANDVFEKFLKTIKAGQTEEDMEWSLLSIAHDCGASGFAFPPIIACGRNSADVHHKNSSYFLKKGDKIMIDFGIIYNGYNTDMTRVVYTSKPSESEQKIYSIVSDANNAGIKAIKIGLPVRELDKAARDVIEKAGYGKYFGHSTGHGVGTEIHELPNVSALAPDKYTVQPGMVFTIEPGIYGDRFAGGVRIEDMVYINRKGKTEVLTDAVSKKIRIINI